MSRQPLDLFADQHTGPVTLEKKRVDLPYGRDIAAGKNTYVYDAHTYHTKVPPQGIAQLISYYTEAGDTVVDPFCGSGMTGVAALELSRRAVLSDLSPAAVFIARNLCTPVDHQRFMQAVDELMDQSAELAEKLYTTECRECGKPATMLYTVWSYELTCNRCGEDFCLWDVARDERANVRESKILSSFQCPHCQELIAKRGLKRGARRPVEIGYKCCSRGRQEQRASPNADDLALFEQLERDGVPPGLWYPTHQFPVGGVNTRQPIAAGIDSVDKAYTKRALWAMAHLWQLASNYPDQEISEKLKFALTSLYQRVTLFSEFRFWGGSGNTANYNVPQIANEQNVFVAFRRKAATISWYFREAPQLHRDVYVGVHSATDLSHISDGGADYIFTDPPFGSNINYSEMNLLWESWLGSFTNTAEEAIVSKAQGKAIDDYQILLCRAFCEARRILRPDGWMTVVFHNSSDKVWQALQGAITGAGFVIRGTQTFDKKHGTFKMHVSDNAVGYDLVLHCQKQSSPEGSVPVLPESTLEACVNFIRNALRYPERYRTRYIHVSREEEFDYRRMYAEWLCSAIATGAIDVDFGKFRNLVDSVQAEAANA